MKRKGLISMVAAGSMLVACATTQPQLIVQNDSIINLTDKAITIQRSEIEGKIGDITDGQLLFLSADNNLLPCQLDDLDGDGNWDEIFTLVDLKAGESKAFKLVVKSKADAPKVVKRTNIRFADINDPSKEYTELERLKSNTTEISQTYFQFEGPGWENDMVAFRNYFDARNGIDIFGKTTTEMALDSCGIKGGPVYHYLQSWGMDILKVANSLGAGAIALETSTGLYRVGPDCLGTYNLVAEGPLRSIIDLNFEGMEVDSQSIEIKHRISIEAGKPWYESEVTVTGAENTRLVTGIVNLHSDSVYSGSNENYAYMYTHDNQAYDGEKLGLAIIVPQNSITVQTAPEEGEGITQTFYTALEITEKPIVFYFMAGWEKQDARWTDKAEFEKGINEQAMAIAAKVSVEIK